MANLYCELQIRDIRLQNANDDKCSLQEKIEVEADRHEFGELKVKLKRIEELEKENDSLRSKEKKSFELEKSFEEKIVHVEKEIVHLQKKIVEKKLLYSEKLKKLEANIINSEKELYDLKKIFDEKIKVLQSRVQKECGSSTEQF